MNLIEFRYLIMLVFLPILYWLLPRSMRLLAVSIFSLAAVAAFSYNSALALALITIFTYFVYHAAFITARQITLSIIALALIFLAYKCLPLVGTSGASIATNETGPIVLIGMAFYMLKAIRVLMDRQREPMRGSVPADLFFAYMLFFPTILIGPIHGLQEFHNDWRQQSFSAERSSSAVERLIWGYAKLVLIGGYLVNFKMVYAIQDLPPGFYRFTEYLQDLRYGLHLYFTFAGASDVAIAFSSMLGFRIGENFNHPFMATSIAEFWRRWHISLSSWVRNYVYAPLAAATRNHGATLILTMGLIGAWHELSVRYLIWGAYHGAGLVIHHRWSVYSNRFAKL